MNMDDLMLSITIPFVGELSEKNVKKGAYDDELPIWHEKALIAGCPALKTTFST